MIALIWHKLCMIFVGMCLLSLGGCSLLSPIKGTSSAAFYELSWLEPLSDAQLAVASTQTNLRPIQFLGVSAPDWLRQSKIVYSLDFDDAYRLRQYAYHRWAMPLSQQFQQHIQRSLLMQPGLQSDAPWSLRLELIDFRQHFVNSTTSLAKLSVWAVLQHTDGRVVKQQFNLTQPAADANASAGVTALNQLGLAFNKALISWVVQQTNY